jgi:hypothetical protein
LEDHPEVSEAKEFLKAQADPSQAYPQPVLHLYWQVFVAGLAKYPAVTALSEVPPDALDSE